MCSMYAVNAYIYGLLVMRLTNLSGQCGRTHKIRGCWYQNYSNWQHSCNKHSFPPKLHDRHFRFMFRFILVSMTSG